MAQATSVTKPQPSVLGSNRDLVRQHNLSAVLRLLRINGNMSRSLLAQRTSLNRSTISDLVTELEELGLIHESDAPDRTGVGRPSLMVSLTDDVVVFAVNPDTDATTVGVVTLSGHVLRKERVAPSIPPDPEAAVRDAGNLIKQMRKELPAHVRVAGVGVAVPGQVRVGDGVIRLAPNLNWVEVPFASMLNQTTGLPVVIDNDASLGAIAERDYGAGRGFSEIIYMYGGAGGIGGGIIHAGSLLRGSAGYAGELGHVRISDVPGDDYSGLQGTLEALVKRDQLLNALGVVAADDDELTARLEGPVSGKVKKLLETQIDALAIAVGNFVNIFNPEIVLLSGYLAVLFGYDSDRLLSRFRWSTLNAPQDRLLVRTGELGPNLLMIGAAGIAFGPLVSQPASTQLFAAQ